MNKIITSFATLTAGQPFLAPTSVDHIQEAYTTLLTRNAIAQVGASYSASTAYILEGCRSSTTGSGTNITQGLVLFNGEVYYSPARFVSSGVGVIVASVAVSYAAADPITFTDSSTHDVHQYRQVTYTVAASGAGDIADFDDFVRVNTANMDYVETATSISAITVDFDRNKHLAYNSTASSSTITLDCAKAISGRVVTLRCATGTAGHVIDFAGASGTTPVAVNEAYPYTLTDNVPVYIKMQAIEVAAATFVVYIEIYELQP